MVIKVKSSKRIIREEIKVLVSLDIKYKEKLAFGETREAHTNTEVLLNKEQEGIFEISSSNGETQKIQLTADIL